MVDAMPEGVFEALDAHLAFGADASGDFHSDAVRREERRRIVAPAPGSDHPRGFFGGLEFSAWCDDVLGFSFDFHLLLPRPAVSQ